MPPDVQNTVIVPRTPNLATPDGFLAQLHTEAGIVAVLLAIGCLFLVWLWKQERQAFRDERASHMGTIDKLYALGTEQTKQLAVVGTTLDKVYQVFLSHNKD